MAFADNDKQEVKGRKLNLKLPKYWKNCAIEQISLYFKI